MLLGGSAADGQIKSSVCLLFALGLLASELWEVPRLVGSQRSAAKLLVAAMLLAVIQLIPLPPWLWQDLPGRELVVETLRAADLPADTYRPLTLDPLATAAALFHLVPTIAIFLAVSRISPGCACRNCRHGPAWHAFRSDRRGRHG
jgi:hypothetical protein